MSQSNLPRPRRPPASSARTLALLYPFLTPQCRYLFAIADQCDICGIKALDGQNFSEERLPFLRAKSYCENCQRRYYERVYLFLTIFILAAALIYFIRGIARGRSDLLANTPVWLLILLLQWPLIVVHELGHGLFARAFGYGPVRLFIGSGKTLVHFSFLGFTWFINLIPFGGLAYAAPKHRVLRWQWIFFISGGLLANTLLLTLAWIFFRTDSPILPRNLLYALIIANALVIAENILPYTAQTLFGPLDTDGKLLYQALFRWNKPPSPPSPPSKGHRLTFSVLKILAVTFLALCAILLLFIGGFIFYDAPAGLIVRFSIGAFLISLGVLLFWYAWRLVKEPLAPSRHDLGHSDTLSFWRQLESASPSEPEALALIQTHIMEADYQSAHALSAPLSEAYSNDKWLLWLHAGVLLGLNQPAAAEAAYDRLLAQLADSDPSLLDNREVHLAVFSHRLRAILLQNDGRFENERDTLLRRIVSDQQKISLLDQLACIPLVQDQPHLYHSAESCIRKALQIAPNTLTLQGTLGGLLAERGQFTEAEPLLRACHQSPAIHDRGITSYYLALLAEKNGDLSTARKLAKQSIALYPEPWLTKKANALLARLKTAP